MMTHLNIAGPQAPLQLAGGDWMHSMRSPDLISSGLADAQIRHLSFFHELLYIACTSKGCINMGSIPKSISETAFLAWQEALDKGRAGPHLELIPGLLNGHSPVHAMLHGHGDF